MFWQRVASLVKFYTNQKKILPSAERPRYEYSASVLRRICRQQFSQQISRMIKEMTRGDKGKLFIRLFLYLLSPYSARLCAPCVQTKKNFLPSAERPRYEYSASVLRRVFPVNIA